MCIRDRHDGLHRYRNSTRPFKLIKYDKSVQGAVVTEISDDDYGHRCCNCHNHTETRKGCKTSVMEVKSCHSLARKKETFQLRCNVTITGKFKNAIRCRSCNI